MKNIKKIIKILFFLISPFIILVVVFIFFLYFASTELDKARWFGGKKSNFFDVREEGFMYPTFSWCDDDRALGVEDCRKSIEEEKVSEKTQIPILLTKETNFKPERSMIVRVKDVKNNWHLYGRIIGLPGETIKLKGGYVYINNTILDEPYIWKRGITYGDSNLNNCNELKLGENQVFVMGDNRIISGYFDSRGELGIVSIDNITHYLPLKYQKDYYQERWNKLGNKEVKKVNLSSEELTNKFVEFINKIRLKKGLSLITFDQRLVNAAKMRAKNVIKKRNYNHQEISEELTYAGAFSLNGTIFEKLLQGYYDEESYEAFIRNYKKFFNENVKKIGVAYDKAGVDGCEHSVTIIYYLEEEKQN